MQNGHSNGNRSLAGMVDMAAGTVSREIFVNEEIYAQEQEYLFARAWLFVGHVSQIPKPGDYFVSCMGEESVILCRDREGEVHVFLNSCTHRGMKVCRYDEGNTPVFSCPYHGWSFATDGKLVGVPYFKDAYKGALDKSQWGLIEVPKLCIYKGTVWANLGRAALPLLRSTWAATRHTLTSSWTPGTEPVARRRCSAALRSGLSPATGNSLRRISSATGTTTSATAR